MKNQAISLISPMQVEISEIEMPVLGPDSLHDVIVRVEYVGICGSDAHFFEHGKIGTNQAPFPFILGHEVSGVIVEAGNGVSHLQKGDRVVLEPGVPCGSCSFCLGGRYNLCPSMRFMSAPPVDGALQKFIRYPARWAYRLPEGLSLLEGALVEPLAVGMHAAQRAGVSAGHTVAILGGGCIGLTALLASKALGASKIIVSDLFESRLKRAKELGANETVNAKSEDVIERVAELTNATGADVVFETAGSPATAAQSIHMVKRGGVVAAVGNITPDVAFSFRQLYLKEAELRAVFRYKNLFPAALSEIGAGRISVKPIASHFFRFDEARLAFETAIHHKEDVVKAVVAVGVQAQKECSLQNGDEV